MKKSLLSFVTFFSLVSLFAQSQNYTVDMYALSNYSNEYYTVEKLDLQTPDGNEFCIMALQKNGFSIQQSFADDHVLCISHLYFEYAGNDRFRLVSYTEEHIDRYAEDKDFTEIDYKIDENLYFEDITSDWVYKKHIEGK